MTTAVTGISPYAYRTGIFSNGALSQYMENNSIFNTTPYTPAFTGGIGIGQNYYDMMAFNSDNMTSLAFKQRSNQHVLGSYSEIMQKNLPEMATALRNGQAGKAALLYNEIYEAISKNYGEELTTQEQRVAFDQSVKATIANMYQKVNGYPLANDIKENGEGFFSNGFMQGLTFGNHSSNSAEELESYMLGTGIEGYTGKKIAKGVGKILGYGTSIGGCAAIGAGIGAVCGGGVASWLTAPVGAAIGAGVGAVLTLGSWLFSGNEPTVVKKAF